MAADWRLVRPTRRTDRPRLAHYDDWRGFYGKYLVDRRTPIFDKSKAGERTVRTSPHEPVTPVGLDGLPA